jgi:hypothetical protein
VSERREFPSAPWLALPCLAKKKKKKKKKKKIMTAAVSIFK